MEKYLETFTRAVTDVFSEIGFSEITLKESDYRHASSEVVANIGLTGDLQGYLLLRADLKSAKRFIDKMLTNMSMETDEQEFGQFHKEALGEVLNQVSGRSTMNLQMEKVDCDITPPTIVTGQDIYYDITSMDASTYQEISGDYGSIGLFVGIKKIR